MKKKNDPSPSKKRGGLSEWLNRLKCPFKVSVMPQLDPIPPSQDERLAMFRKLYPAELVNLIFNLGGDFTTADNVLAVVAQSHGGMYLCECDNPECLLEQHLDDEQYIRLSFANYPRAHISRVVHPDCNLRSGSDRYFRAPR